MRQLTHLDRLEAESIHILRETVAEAEQAGDALFDRQGFSAVMLHLAKKAFFPAPLPFPLLHVDTTWKFRDMYALRDKVARGAGHRADRLQEPGGRGAGHQPVRPRPAAHRHVEDRRAEAGARQVRLRRGVRRRPARRGEEPRQGARLQLPRPRTIAGTRSASGPSCGRSTMSARTRARASASSRLSNWTELDVWQYILREGIEIVPLYFAAERPTVERDGLILMVDDERLPLERRDAGDAQGALPHARLLSAVGRGRERGRDASRRSSPRCC